MKPTSKREQLVTAAKALFYERGVENTTLAQTAQRADVRPGNVFYHFNTKDALVEAVIASHGQDILEQLGRFNAERDPKARLRAFLRSSLSARDVRARHGCPYATLDAELKKSSSSASRSSGSLLQLHRDWLERQFRDLGREDARDLALDFLAGVQGAYVLALAANDPNVLEHQIARLEHRVVTL